MVSSWIVFTLLHITSIPSEILSNELTSPDHAFQVFEQEEFWCHVCDEARNFKGKPNPQFEICRAGQTGRGQLCPEKECWLFHYLDGTAVTQVVRQCGQKTLNRLCDEIPQNKTTCYSPENGLSLCLDLCCKISSCNSQQVSAGIRHPYAPTCALTVLIALYLCFFQ